MAKNRLPARGFVQVKCPDCSNEQVLFVKAASPVTCLVCGSTLAAPSGGLVEVRAKVIGAVD